MDLYKYGNLSLAIWFFSLLIGGVLFAFFPINITFTFIPVYINFFTVLGSLGMFTQLVVVHLASYFGQASEALFDNFMSCAITTFLLFVFMSTNFQLLLYLIVALLLITWLEAIHPNWLYNLKNKIWPQI